jgi:hypothetical protein
LVNVYYLYLFKNQMLIFFTNQILSIKCKSITFRGTDFLVVAGQTFPGFFPSFFKVIFTHSLQLLLLIIRSKNILLQFSDRISFSDNCHLNPRTDPFGTFTGKGYFVITLLKYRYFTSNNYILKHFTLRAIQLALIF